MLEDRYHAGKILAKVLQKYLTQNQLDTNDIVVAVLPRGGLPVAFEFLKNTGVDFFVLPVKKISSPYSEEVAIWAIAPDGFYLVDSSYVSYLGIDQPILEALKNKAWIEVKTRLQKYWVDLSQLQAKVQGKVAILVDDGVATGYTAAVAWKFLKNLGAQKVILAVPVCPAQLPEILKQGIDEVICLLPIRNFQAVGQGYANFAQVEDEEFFGLLEQLNQN